MTAPDPRVGEIENRLAAITPGYWEYEVGSGNVFNDHEYPDLIANVENIRDGVFIRSAPTDMAYLLAELRKRDEAIRRVQAVHSLAHRAVEPWAIGYRFSGDHCAHDGQRWPCDTIAAVTGDGA